MDRVDLQVGGGGLRLTSVKKPTLLAVVEIGMSALKERLGTLR